MFSCDATCSSTVCLVLHRRVFSSLLGDSSGHVRCFDLTQPLVATGSRHYPAPLLSSLADAHEQHVTGVDFHPLGHVLSSVGAEGKLKLW